MGLDDNIKALAQKAGEAVKADRTRLAAIEAELPTTVHKSGVETIGGTKTFTEAIVGDLAGTALKATNDADGNAIKATYLKQTDASATYATQTALADETEDREEADEALGDRIDDVEETLSATDARLTQDVSNRIRKFYTNTLGETHLADSDDGDMRDIELFGMSRQKQYEGRNLIFTQDIDVTDKGSHIVCSSGTYTVSGATTAVAKGSSYTIDGVYRTNYANNVAIVESTSFPVSAGTYIFSTDMDTSSSGLQVSCSFGQVGDTGASSSKFIMIGSTSKNPKTITLTEDCRAQFVLQISDALTTTKTFHVQLESGSTATSYEPYVGGKPSPSPEYPQDIKSVAEGDEVEVCGKNLLDMDAFFTAAGSSAATKEEDGLWLVYSSRMHSSDVGMSNGGFNIKGTKSSSTYTLSIKINGISSPFSGIYIAAMDSDGVWRTKSTGVQLGDGTYSASMSCVGLKAIAISYGTPSTCKVLGMQVEEGATATVYKPFSSATATIPAPLRAIPCMTGGSGTSYIRGNVTIDGQDYIADTIKVNDDGTGSIIRRVGVFTGSNDSYVVSSGYSTETYVCAYKNASGAGGSALPGWDGSFTGGMLCDKFATRAYTYPEAKTGDTEFFSATGQLHFRILRSRFNGAEPTRDTVKAVLDEIDPTFYYPLRTPTTTALTATQLQSFLKLRSHYPATNIIPKGEVAPRLDALYPCSIEGFVEYVKEQQGDTRQFVYDLDRRTLDAETLAELAYVNGEYAATLAEIGM